MDRIQNLLIDPGEFISQLRTWAGGKGIDIEETYLQVTYQVNQPVLNCLDFYLAHTSFIKGIMFAKLNPENVSPTELLTMLTDPRTPICDTNLVSRVIEARNMTEEQVQV